MNEKPNSIQPHEETSIRYDAWEGALPGLRVGTASRHYAVESGEITPSKWQPLKCDVCGAVASEYYNFGPSKVPHVCGDCKARRNGEQSPTGQEGK